MNFKKIIFIIICIVVLQFKVSAQEDITTSLNDIIEEIASNSDIELDYTVLFQTLENLYNNPIDINKASQDDYKDLIFLTEFQIYSLVNYRKKYGNYNTIYELQFVDGIDQQTLKLLLPFISINTDDNNSANQINLKQAVKYGKHTIISRYNRLLQKKQGYNEIPDSILAINPNKSRYLGSPDKLYLKYNYAYKNKLFYGITAEKDDGEEFFKGSQKYGFDFYSFHIQINGLKYIKKLIIGDFSAQFGQGLTMWSGLTFGKSTSTLNVIKKPRGITRYTSVNESSFFRGQAISLSYKNFNFTEFVSYKPIDAGISASDTSLNSSEEEIVSSFYESGYHRTPTELQKKRQLKEFVTGANFNWSSNNFKIGATGLFYSFSKSIGSTNYPYQQFNFVGKSNANLGIDYLWTINKIHLFGETSISKNLGYATINGAVLDIVPEFKLSIVHRYYRNDYQALYAQVFSEGNKPNKEIGLYLGAEIYPIKYIKIDAYIDAWKFPWLRYGCYAPSTGREYVLQTTYYPQRNLEMYVKIKYETKQKNNSDIQSGIRPLKTYDNYRFRYNLMYNINEQWTIKSRVELAKYNVSETNQWGYLLSQDFQYKPYNLPLVFTARFAIFETDSYDSRIYAYEPDVLYGFSVPAYYSKGIRSILVIKYAALKNCDFWFRIANTYFYDKDYLGTGLDKIDSKNRTDIKLQVKYSF